MKKKLILGSALLLGLAACDQTPEATGIDSITAEDLHAKIKILASDEFQGRAPSSPGEEITVAYIRDEFIKYGLEPGNNGSWYQDVPLVDITADANQTLTFSGGEGEDISLTYKDDYVALASGPPWTTLRTPAGKPACRANSTILWWVRGSCSLGLRTKVFPLATA